MGELNFKKPSGFPNFSEIFHCGMTRPRNANLESFIQCQYARTVLRK